MPPSLSADDESLLDRLAAVQVAVAAQDWAFVEQALPILDQDIRAWLNVGGPDSAEVLRDLSDRHAAILAAIQTQHTELQNQIRRLHTGRTATLAYRRNESR